MTKVYQEDINKAACEIIELIDGYKGYEWSASDKSDKYFDKFQMILEEIFDYPDFRNHN
jgi:hypothetical protein